MRNIKLTIEYDGTNYSGWQTQRAQKTVQKTIETALGRMLGEEICLTASGRTDSGVHALGQAANFKTKTRLSCEKIKRALNGNLPQDISIKDCRDVMPDFNARFDVKSKLYRYTIYNSSSKMAINRQYVCRLAYPLDINIMKKEAKALVGKRDFKAFHASGRKVDDCIRHIKRIDIKKDKKNFIYIDIEANGFLYNMARNIVGTLVEVGRGKMLPGSTKKILKKRNRNIAGPTMPAKGLCLVKVKY